MTAAAQSYPSRPVRLIVPFPPGGSNDLVGRMIAAQLSTRLDKPVFVENQGGAGGLIGTEMAARSQPDFETEGAEPLSMSPEEVGRFIAAETAKWARVVKDAGIRAE